ncbi:MAG TPA: VOC family protein [Bacteroidota bacterium]
MNTKAKQLITEKADRFFGSLRISDVWLRVLDLERVAAFYRDIIGLRETRREQQVVRLSASGSEPAQVVLVGDPGARPRSATAPGLFHTAFLLSSRKELALILRHIGESGWRFQGFADHGVSEAIYLADPEGNGLELYRDRRPEDWPVRSSGIAMVTEPLDVHGLLEEVKDVSVTFDGIEETTMIGHVHLQTSNLENAHEFYHGLLGLDVTQRDYPGALFLSANGYHHHIGLNVWNSRGAPPSSPNSAGLISFGMVADPSRIDAMLERARDKEVGVHKTGAGKVRFLDPSELSLDVSVS